MSLPTRPGDEQFSAWLDGELPADDQERVLAWLREHPEDAARVRLWAADRDALRARFDPLLDEPVPQALADLVSPPASRAGLGRGPASNDRAWARAAMAAGLLIVGGLAGALVTWQWGHGQATSAQGTAQAHAQAQIPAGPTGPTAEGPSTPGGSWTQRAAVAHVVYAPEQRHPVEVDVRSAGGADAQRAQEEHLQRWLTKRLDMPVRLYDLRPQGFELVGGRLLPDAAGPSAQLMYQDAGGQRVTLYLRRPEAGTDTAFRFHREGAVGMFYWVEPGYGCALVGTLPRERLLALAESVYRQAEAAEAHAAPGGSAEAGPSGPSGTTARPHAAPAPQAPTRLGS